MFKHGPDLMFNALFNLPQGLFMALTVSFYQGIFAPTQLFLTFVQAYCIGVTLTAFLRVNDWGETAARHVRNRCLHYIVANTVSGGIMGILMNALMTLMAVGATVIYPAAFLHCLWISVLASAVSANLWIGPVGYLVGKKYPRKTE